MTSTLSPENAVLSALLVTEYAGALPPSEVRTLVERTSDEMPTVQEAPRARGELLADAVRRRLTERLATVGRQRRPLS